MNRKLIAVVASGLLLALTAGSVAYAANPGADRHSPAAMTTSPDRSGSSTPRPAVPRSAKRPRPRSWNQEAHRNRPDPGEVHAGSYSSGVGRRRMTYKIGVLEMRGSQSSSRSNGHPWTKAQVGDIGQAEQQHPGPRTCDS